MQDLVPLTHVSQVVLAPSLDLWSVGICVLETVFLSSLLTDRYLQLKTRSHGQRKPSLKCAASEVAWQDWL